MHFGTASACIDLFEMMITWYNTYSIIIYVSIRRDCGGEWVWFVSNLSNYSYEKYPEKFKASWRARAGLQWSSWLAMSKQSTLFKAWDSGGKDPTGCQQPHKSDLRTSTASNHVSVNSVADCYEIPDDEFANFLDDDLIDEDLLKSYGGDFTTQGLHAQPSTSGAGNKLHQKTLTFHVGPSHSLLNSSVVEEDIPGFDSEAGELWIYPTNYPIRDYQYNIVQRALFTNTLVCLPTGLGKTFIAAVVMYNFYRWYPDNKIVFLAPTKPLVTQQIEACHGVMGIPQQHAAEMTGTLYVYIMWCIN